MKRKAVTSRAPSNFEEMGRRVTRLQARLRDAALAAQTNPQPQTPSSESSCQSANNYSAQFVSLSSSSKSFKETEVDTSELLKSGSDTIHSLNDRRWQRESNNRHSSCNTSAGIRAVLGNLMGLVSSPAQEDSPAAPPGNVQSHACVGDKTKDCNNSRLAETTIEVNAASEGTLAKEKSSASLMAQNHGRPEPDKNGPPSVTAEDANGVPVARDAPAPTQSYGIGLTELVHMHRDSIQDEVQSNLFDLGLVSVQGYKVKEASAPILRKVIGKHGDIAMNCTMETMETRSLLLEKISDIIGTLQTSKFVNITEVEVKNMLVCIKDFEIVKVNVGWLRERVEEILEAVQLCQQAPELKARKTKTAQILQEARRALETYETRIQKYKTLLQELNEKANLERQKIVTAKNEHARVVGRVSNLQPKVTRFVEESLIYDLL